MAGGPCPVTLLLVRSGGWLVGVEADLVRRIDTAALQPLARDLADLLGHRQGVEVGAKKVRRALCVDERGALLVDDTLGTRSLTAESVYGLPALVRDSGTPAWIIGLAWLDGQPVVLIDLLALPQDLPS